MSLRASLFNKSIYKSDIKRYWWVAFLETLFILAAAVLPVYENCMRNNQYANDSWRCVPTWDLGGLPIIIVFSVGVGVILFSYLHHVAPVSFHHSIPLKRKTLYITKLLSAVTLTFVPIILNGLIFAAMSAKADFSGYFTIGQAISWMCAGFLYTSVLLTLTMTVSMMTGSSVGVLVFTTGFALLPLIFVSFFQLFFDFELYGYVTPVTYTFIEHIYPNEKNILGGSYLATYLAMGIIFGVLGYVLYRRRKLENHGEVIAYSWLKPLFITIIGILSSMLSYLYFCTVLEFTSVWLILPVGLFGTVVAWMISRKSLSLNGVIKPISLYTVIALAFCITIRFDLTGFEKRVPDIDDVESATIVRSGRYPGSDRDADFTEQKDIENVIALHKYLTEDKSYSQGYNIPIEYRLKNGKVMRREYAVDYQKDARFLKPLYETYQLKSESFAIIREEEQEFYGITIYDRRLAGIEIYPDNAYMQKFIAAIIKDINALEYEDYMINNGGSTVLEIRYSVKDSVDGEIRNFSYSYAVNDNYKNTMALLKEIGFYNNLPRAEDFSSASISVWENGDYMSEKEAMENLQVITDKAEIQTLYSFYDSMINDKKFTSEDCVNIRVEYKLNSGHTFDVSCSYDRDRIPQELAKYFD